MCFFLYLNTCKWSTDCLALSRQIGTVSRCLRNTLTKQERCCRVSSSKVTIRTNLYHAITKIIRPKFWRKKRNLAMMIILCDRDNWNEQFPRYLKKKKTSYSVLYLFYSLFTSKTKDLNKSKYNIMWTTCAWILNGLLCLLQC